MEALTLADDGRRKTDDGYEYDLSRVPGEVDALGLAKILAADRPRGVEVSHAGGTATIVVTGLEDDDREHFESELRAMLDQVNKAHAAVERVQREGDTLTNEDLSRGEEDEAAVKESFERLD